MGKEIVPPYNENRRKVQFTEGSFHISDPTVHIKGIHPLRLNASRIKLLEKFQSVEGAFFRFELSEAFFNPHFSKVFKFRLG